MELMHPQMPWITALIAVFAAVLGWLWYRMVRRRSTARMLPVAHSSRSIDTARFAQLRRRYRGGLAGMMSGALIFLAGMGLMLARPSTAEVTEHFDSSRDIMLCADISGSMEPVSREVMEHFRTLMTELPDDRIGLTVFNGTAMTMIPLTDDHHFAQERLADVEGRVGGEMLDMELLAGTMSNYGSSLVGDGLVSCLERFDRLDDERPRAVVLATDNEVFGDELFTVKEAADLARGRDITVYGISPPAIFQADTDRLQDAVESTGGQFFLVDDESLVEGVAEQITAEEASMLELPPTVTVLDEPHIPFIIASLGLLVLAGFAWRLGP